MEELEKTARELILAITEKTLKSLKDKRLLKEPSKLQMLCSSPEMTSLIKKLSTPKYDPNRKLKKGDKVRVVEYKGRIGSSIMLVGTRAIVTQDEEELEWVAIKSEDGIKRDSIDPAYLELVTPVEELEPYYIEESHDGATIVLTVRCIPNGEGIAFRYCPGWGGNVFHSEEQFRQHAVAERDRLNAEHRKELGK